MFYAASVLLLALHQAKQAIASECRVIPEDPEWPSVDAWDSLNSTVDGRLVQTVPVGTPCYAGPSFNEDECQAVQASWHNPDFHEDSSSSIMAPLFAHHSCDPFSNSTTSSCGVGSYVSYSVNVSSSDDIIAATQFVRENNLRLVVRNTAHDYQGRATAKGALAVWTHYLKDIEWNENYSSEKYTGPAVKVQAGVLGQEVYESANERGYAVVGGSCPSIGHAGGYAQSGGHGILSPVFGLASDQTLEFEVVTTEGELVVASPTENSDLYWALSGGGGGTYGIVYSMTVKAYPDAQIAFASFTFPKTDDEEQYQAAVKAHFLGLKNITDAGVYVNTQWLPTVFNAPLIIWYNHTQEELDDLLSGHLQALGDTGVNLTYHSTDYPTYLDMYNGQSLIQNTDGSIGFFLFGGRLIPKSLYDTEETFQSYMDVIATLMEEGDGAVYVAIPSLENYPDNAVLPAWRESLGVMVPLVLLSDLDTEADYATKSSRLTELNNHLVAITDGAYVNEADPLEADWKNSFYGENYDRLLEIKDKYDPSQLLYASINVGGDRWAEDSQGRLCQV